VCGPPFASQVDAGCPTDKIAFTQATGCTGCDSYELCIPDPTRCPAALQALEQLVPDVTCFSGTSAGRAGCDTTWQRLCLVPTTAASGRCALLDADLLTAMTDAGWAQACAVASLPFVPQLVLTRYP
jgi:hypothetical protein